MPKLEVIGFDADDTLWENESFYRMTQAKFADLLREFADPDHLAERIVELERRNLKLHGYGIKGFTLSLIETAIQVTDGRVSTEVIAQILKNGQELLTHPLDLIDGVEEVVTALFNSHRLVLITKGDLFDQERKLAQSGLAPLFDQVEIVSEKNESVYERAFGKAPAMMIGNSLKSDVIPALNAGAWGVHVPHEHEWVLERADPPTENPKFRKLEKISDLPALIAEIES